VGKLLGFLRIQAVAIALGASSAADALLLSLTVLTLFDAVFVSGAAILAAQALYVRRHAKNAERMALAGLARSAALWTLLGLMFGAVCALFGEPLAAIVAPGFSPETRATFATCCALASLLPASTALMVFASALNRINGREVLYTVNQALINGASLAAILVAGALHASAVRIILAFLFAILLSTLVMFTYQVRCLAPAQRRLLTALYGRALSPRALWKRLAQHLRELRVVAPIVGALVIQQVLVLISYSFATRAGPGFLLLFGLAERLTNVVYGVFVLTFLTVLEPRWARAAHTSTGSAHINSDVGAICMTLIPLTAVLACAGDSLAQYLFGHGAMSAADVERLASITRVYGLALPGISLGVVFARLLIIHGQGDRILFVNAGITLMHLGLSYATFERFGMLAVTASLVVSLAVQAVLYARMYSAAAGEHADGSAALAWRLGLLTIMVLAASTLAAGAFEAPLVRLTVVTLVAILSTAVGAMLMRLRLMESMRRLLQL
jgi:putative peptidoglycan lipid II flippase